MLTGQLLVRRSWQLPFDQARAAGCISQALAHCLQACHSDNEPLSAVSLSAASECFEAHPPAVSCGGQVLPPPSPRSDAQAARASVEVVRLCPILISPAPCSPADLLAAVENGDPVTGSAHNLLLPSLRPAPSHASGRTAVPVEPRGLGPLDSPL